MGRRLCYALAGEMRRSPTGSEDMFWHAVRGRRLDGVKFRRQQVIETFIVDFFVPSHRLVIEIDGGIHRLQTEHDALRQQFLDDCGLSACL
jgi:very-short-patch-repair endonuclease